MQYRYDANGNRTQTQLPNGETFDYLYYGSGHLSAIKYNGSLISEFERDKLHREVQRTQGRLTTNYELDPVGKLKAQLNAQIERHYHYDNAGNLTQSKDNLTNTTQYGYDKLGRLTHATSPLSRETFAFDPAHNIIEREGQKQQNNQVNHYHGTQYRYDGLGNLIERKLPTGEIQHYRYNLNDHLIEVSITKANGRTETWRYAYDPLGRRTDKRSETNKNLHTKFVWDGSHLIQEYNEQGQFTYIYTHPNSYEPLAQIKENGEVYYYHCDQIGAPRELTNQNGELCWYASYKGWGELQGEHNLKGVHQPIRLQNQYFDKETGLHYNFFRYYDPTVGRFTIQDPIGLAGGANLYQFESTVQNAIDPLGLHTEIIVWQPVGWGGSSFGHISSNVNGVNYSWGPAGWDTNKSASDYAKSQMAFRSGVGIPLSLTKEQENKLVSCYARERGEYQFLVNNCGDPHKECLSEVLGKRGTTSIRPVSIGFDYFNSPYATKEKIIYKGPERGIFSSNPISQW